ncbi:MAG: hypothetical protein ACI9GW_002029 [Halieaceae bacterium]|jgi:hypothetical protein
MLPWKYSRIIIIIAWLLPFGYFIFNISTELARANSEEGPLIWEADVRALEKGDLSNPPPENPVLFLGARQISLWTELSDYLEPLPIMRRGIGSANIEDLEYYYDRLVTPYNPSAVVILPSQSDFSIRGAGKAWEYSIHFKHLSEKLMEDLPQAKIYVISATKAPRLPDAWRNIDLANKELIAYAKTEPRVTYISVLREFQNAEGEPTPSTFRSDGILFSDWGYMRMTAAVLKHLEEDFPAYF